jgi:HAE1 family hydrophobic/amphiphilic exporter-1
VGVQAAMIMDQGVIIMDSLSVLLDSGRMGAFFAMVVLFFFLRRLRMSLIIALSIPLSIVVALVVMFFAGESLNILSLLGLMISVGLLVDNSVVVAENIHRLHRQGLTRMQACLQGTGEISLAIVTATLTTVVVFLPVALVEGQGQFFMMRMAIPITVSLLASLIVALTVVPLAMYLTLPSRSALASATATGRWRRAHERLNGVLRRAYEATFGRLGRGYQAALGYFLQRRLDLVLLLVVAFVATGFLVKGRLEVVPMSQDDQSGFQVGVRMPSNTTFEETEAWFRSAEVRIAALQEDLGLEFYVLFHQRNFGQIQGSLRSDRDQELKPRVVVERLLEALPELPGLELDTGQASEGGDEQAVATETVTIFGDDPEALDEIGVLLEERLATLPGVLGLLSTRDRQPNELALVPDRELTQRLGVEPRTLAGVVGYALRGQALPRIYFGGRDIPVRVRFEESDRSSLAELRSFAVPTPEGSAALSSLVSVEQLPAATAISRRDKRTARRVVLELEEGQEKEGRAAIRQALTAIDLPEGMSFAPPAASDANAREIRNLQFAALLSILFVYLLMGFLFESFVLPISILVTIPLASLGVLWSHLLARRDLDFLGMVAVIVLIGVVVNNGIVLVDYVHRLREAGMPRFETLLAASERRFRPIMMTALTTICGMVPLVLATPTQMGISYKSFGLALIGGMVTSTLLTLLVVPVFYTFLEDGREACGRALRQAIAGGRRRGSALDQPTRVIDGEADFGELAASRVE